MNILLIDTATNIEIVALRYNGIIVDKTMPTATSHSVTLFDTIDSACKKLHTTIHSINCIGVGIGPGSFTGIRIAVTTARMIAQILKVPLVGIQTHLLFASAIAAQNAHCIIAFDAKKGRVFAARYRIRDNDTLEEIVPPGDYPIDYLITNIDKERIIAVGDGAMKYYDELKRLHPSIEIIPNFIPDAGMMIPLVEKMYNQNPLNYTDFRTVIPYYARKSDAEIVKELKEKKIL